MVVRPWGLIKEKGLFCVGRCGVKGGACICTGGGTYIGGMSTAAVGGGGGGGLASLPSAVCWLPLPSLRGGSVSVSGSMGGPGWWVPSACCQGWSGVLLPRGCCAGGCGEGGGR